jgi:transposase-like protein
MVDDDVMTVADIARILKLNQQTVYTWIKSGVPD